MVYACLFLNVVEFFVIRKAQAPRLAEFGLQDNSQSKKIYTLKKAGSQLSQPF